MPIPVGRSGNVDGGGGMEDCSVCGYSLAGPGWVGRVLHDYFLRIRVESPGLQPGRVRRVSTARHFFMGFEGSSLYAPPLAPESSVAELPNDADSDGTDGS